MKNNVIALYLFLALVFVSACDFQSINYPEKWPEECPIHPSPESWFKCKQRYIYEVHQTSDYSYMNGYGGYYPDYVDPKTSQTYMVNTWLSSLSPEVKESTMYWRAEPYVADFVDDDGWTWYSKGMSGIILDGEFIVFDYPLVLGKTWSATTTVWGFIPVSFDATVVAYITEENEVIVADGYKYELPVDVADVPMPLAELGNITWEDMINVSDEDAQIDWSEVLIPEGPREGENVTGYYVIKGESKMLGITIIRQEWWKDVCGYIPLYDIYKYPPLTSGEEHITKLAKRWTGNKDLEI